MMHWVDIVGWAGAVLVLGAYALVSATYVRGALPSAAVNLIWIGIGLYILLKVRVRRPEA